MQESHLLNSMRYPNMHCVLNIVEFSENGHHHQTTIGTQHEKVT